MNSYQKLDDLRKVVRGNLLVVMVGLPRSGKTTWAKMTGHPIVCPDAIRLSLHGQRYEPLAEQFVWAIAKVMVRALFAAGHATVIVDGTHTTEKRRDEWFDGGWTRAYRYVDTPAEECIRRARALGDEYIVPIIEKQAAQFEPLGPEVTQV